MSDMCAGSGCCKCSSAGVGKQVQNFDRASGIADLITEPVPVRCLFREETGMFKAEWFQVECQFFVMDLPLLWKIEEFPFATAFFAAVVVTVHMLPVFFLFRGIPDDLRVRAYQCVITPAFQLFAATAVDDFIIFPFICNPHNKTPLKCIWCGSEQLRKSLDITVQTEVQCYFAQKLSIISVA